MHLGIGNAIDAIVDLYPTTVGSISSMNISIMIDSSLGKGGIVTIQIPDDNISQKNQLNSGLQFLTNISSVSCQ